MTLVASGTAVTKMIAGGTTVQKVIVDAKMTEVPLSINPSSYSYAYLKLLNTVEVPVTISNAVGAVTVTQTDVITEGKIAVAMRGNGAATIHIYISLTKGTYPVTFTDSRGSKATFTVTLT